MPGFHHSLYIDGWDVRYSLILTGWHSINILHLYHNNIAGLLQGFIFEPTCANCTVDPYISLSVCLAVYLWQKFRLPRRKLIRRLRRRALFGFVHVFQIQFQVEFQIQFQIQFRPEEIPLRRGRSRIGHSMYHQLRHRALRGGVNFCLQKFLSIGRIGIFYNTIGPGHVIQWCLGDLSPMLHSQCGSLPMSSCIFFFKDLSGNPMLPAHILRGQMPVNPGPHS